MGKAGDQAVDKLIDAFRVVVVGVVLIIAAWGILEQILTDTGISVWIKYIVYGLIVFFIYLIRDKVIEFTKSILKQ